MNDDLALPQELAAIVDPVDVTKLESWEDHEQAFLEYRQMETAGGWGQAEVLHSLYIKFGRKSFNEFAKQFHIPASTLNAYARVIKAFPPTTRRTDASFTAHLEASYADKFDDQTQEFAGGKRFEILDKAAEEKLSTRQIKKEVRELKAGELPKLEDLLTCFICNKREIEVVDYLFINTKTQEYDKVPLHPDCYGIIKQAATNERNIRQ